MSDHNRGLLQGSLSVLVLWIINDLAHPVWWVGILIAIAVGITAAAISNLQRAR